MKIFKDLLRRIGIPVYPKIPDEPHYNDAEIAKVKEYMATALDAGRVDEVTGYRILLDAIENLKKKNPTEREVKAEIDRMLEGMTSMDILVNADDLLDKPIIRINK